MSNCSSVIHVTHAIIHSSKISSVPGLQEGRSSGSPGSLNTDLHHLRKLTLINDWLTNDWWATQVWMQVTRSCSWMEKTPARWRSPTWKLRSLRCLSPSLWTHCPWWTEGNTASCLQDAPMLSSNSTLTSSPRTRVRWRGLVWVGTLEECKDEADWKHQITGPPN